MDRSKEEVDGVKVHSLGFSAEGSRFESRPGPSVSMKLFSTNKLIPSTQNSTNVDSHELHFCRVLGTQGEPRMSAMCALVAFRTSFKKKNKIIPYLPNRRIVFRCYSFFIRSIQIYSNFTNTNALSYEQKQMLSQISKKQKLLCKF